MSKSAYFCCTYNKFHADIEELDFQHCIYIKGNSSKYRFGLKAQLFVGCNEIN